MSKSLKLWLAAVLVLSSLPTSRAVAAPPVQKEVPVNIAIHNHFSTRVTFALRNSRGQWERYTINSGGSRAFKGYDGIWVPTREGVTVAYPLVEEGRYAIFWNASKGLLDVRKLEPRS